MKLAAVADFGDYVGTLNSAGSHSLGSRRYALAHHFMPTSMKSLGGSTHIPVVENVLQEMSDFDKAFKTKKRDAALTTAWAGLHGTSPQLTRMKDYLQQCHKMEEQLVGPRPEDNSQPGAADAMENSISAIINQLVMQNGQLQSLSSSTTHEMAGDEGLAKNVTDLADRLEQARQKIESMMSSQPSVDMSGFGSSPDLLLAFALLRHQGSDCIDTCPRLQRDGPSAVRCTSELVSLKSFL